MGGTYFRGLSYLPRHALNYEYLNPSQKNQTHRGNVVRTMATDDSGVLWIDTEDGGLNRLDPQSRTQTLFPTSGEPCGHASTTTPSTATR